MTEGKLMDFLHKLEPEEQKKVFGVLDNCISRNEFVSFNSCKLGISNSLAWLHNCAVNREDRSIIADLYYKYNRLGEN